MKLAPIVLFVFNRPAHTRQTLEALAANDLANESELFIYCDGLPRNATEKDLENFTNVRKLLRERRWCKIVNIIEREQNIGLAQSIVLGVTEVLKDNESVIVLEDDIVTSKSFLAYMNDALRIYRGDQQVMHISGYWFPVKNSKNLPEVFFLRVPTCWGWATWQRAWRNFDFERSLEAYDSISSSREEVSNFCFFHGDYINQLELNIKGLKTTWAVRWYATVFVSRGLCLHPNQSLVQNTGNDGTGVNSANTNQFYWKKLRDTAPEVRAPKKESSEAFYALAGYYLRGKRNAQRKWMLSYYPSRALQIIRSFLRRNILP